MDVSYRMGELLVLYIYSYKLRATCFYKMQKSSDRRVEMASGQRELNQIQETCSRLEQKLGALRAELKGEELRASTLLEDLSQRQRLLASASASAAPASASASTRVVSGMRHTHAAFSSSAVLRREQSALLASASGARRPSAEAFAPSGSGLVRFQLSGSAKQALSTRPVAGGADLSTSQYALRTSASQRLAALGGTSRAGDLLDGRGGGAVSDVLSQAEQQKLENEQLRAEIASLVQKVSSLQQEVRTVRILYIRMYLIPMYLTIYVLVIYVY